MNQQELEQNNILIAEFMGASIEWWEAIDRLGEDTDEDALYCYFPEGDACPSEDLEYHSSWTWLMGVVEEIRRKGEEEKTFSVMLRVEFEKHTRINEMYKLVVEFISWYNGLSHVKNNKMVSFLQT